ncbi:hypothetical protein BH09BAC1_BH09BAC1_10370 [soil metagenome]
MNYHFRKVQCCNMCAAPIEKSKVLGVRLNTSQGLKPSKVTGMGVTIMKCNSCGLIYSNPQPIPSNFNDHYGVNPEEYWEGEYFSGAEHDMTYHASILKKHLEFGPDMKALDIGTGLGFSMLELEKMGFDTYGLEPSANFVNYAIEKNGINPEKLALGMMEDIKYENNFFDFIMLRVVLEHVYDPARCIEQAMAWLKPNGLLHIEVPSSNHLIAKFINSYYRLLGTNYVTNLSPAHAPYHLYEFSADSFIRHGATNNYEVVLAEYYPANVFFFPRFTHPFLQYVMRKTNTGMQIAVWLKKNQSV